VSCDLADKQKIGAGRAGLFLWLVVTQADRDLLLPKSVAVVLRASGTSAVSKASAFPDPGLPWRWSVDGGTDRATRRLWLMHIDPGTRAPHNSFISI
jgi:hypothetical protein